ncbi:DUF6461 domain-containing protein [Nonomuraea maritima]|uniref:DUF6461 domain-containing protein n=1 Tax=Nonomuraea maritima TaxID=683260 RepID=UPI0015A44269|nr:DUF6461 domain-containing protein [Nonomuraea maritima]
MAADDVWELLDEAICVTWVRGAETEDVVRAFNGEPADAARGQVTSVGNHLALQSDEEPEPVVLLRRQGEWIIVLEPGSTIGARDDVLLEASGSGEGLNLTWCVNASLSYATGSAIAVAFDPASMGDDHEGLDDALRWSRSLGIDDGDWRTSWKATAFALVEAVTGIETDDTWTDPVWTPVRIGPSRPARQGAVRLPYVDMRELLARAPRIRDIVEHPGPEQVPRMLQMFITIGLSTADVRTPLTEAALAAIDARPPEAEAELLVGRLRTLSDEYNRQIGIAGTQAQVDDLHRKRNALSAAIIALGPDPLDAFPQVASLTRGLGLRRDNDDYLTLEVLNICYRHIVST